MGDSEHCEPTPRLGDKLTLHAKGFLLPLVGVEAGVEVEPTTAVLQVMNELMDGDVILRGVGQVLPEENDIAVLVQPEDRTWSVVLARPVTEPGLRFPLHVGKFIGDVTATLESKSAALFPLVRSVTTGKMLAELKGVGGKTLQTSFDHTRENALREATSTAGAQAT